MEEATSEEEEKATSEDEEEEAIELEVDESLAVLDELLKGSVSALLLLETLSPVDEWTAVEDTCVVLDDSNVAVAVAPVKADEVDEEDSAVAATDEDDAPVVNSEDELMRVEVNPEPVVELAAEDKETEVAISADVLLDSTADCDEDDEVTTPVEVEAEDEDGIVLPIASMDDDEDDEDDDD